MKTKTFLCGAAVSLAATLIYYKYRKTCPDGCEAVKPFDTKKYLGKWYEIARLDFMFEKNVVNATAHYSLNPDGSIKVVNAGYNIKKDKWQESEGKAVPAGEGGEGKLKVSFFGPFFAGYNVIDIDSDYKYALVAGRNLNYLWILSREERIPENIKKRFLKKAEQLGYDTSKLVWTSHEK